MTAGPSSADEAGRPSAPVRGGAADRPAAARAIPERIAFVGFGLIAGSIARALREAGSSTRIAAWSPSGRGPAEGVRLGIVDVAPAEVIEALDGAGLVVLAGPPLSVLEALAGIADARRGGALSSEATITDVASTKAAIVGRAAELELPFVGGHPMAGRETAGVEASEADLFVDRPWVVVPAPASTHRDVVYVTALAWAAGARPIQLTAEDHDRAVAAISHLPLVVSAALVEAVAGGPGWALARDLAATGWSSMTRLAHGDPEMGAGILATNGEPVAEGLRRLRAVLDGWIDDLEPDAGESRPDGFRARLEAARSALVDPAAPASRE